MSKHHGKQAVFLVEDTSQDHHREKMMVSLGVSITFCLSWVAFSEGSWEKSNWTITVWPSALWKSMCKCCGLLFLPGKEKHCKVTEQGDSKEALPASVCGVNAAGQLFIFASLEKITLFLLENQKGWLATFLVSNGEAGRCYTSDT